MIIYELVFNLYFYFLYWFNKIEIKQLSFNKIIIRLLHHNKDKRVICIMSLAFISKKCILLWIFVVFYFDGFIQKSLSFPVGPPTQNKNYHGKICKNIRVRCKLFVKRNYNDVKSEKSAILNNIYSIIKDDISNDILYYLKFYHLTNDDTTSYFYIVFYELINLSLTKEKDKFKSLPISVSNIIIYMVLKNIILQHFLNHK